jgi:hypothetical protein
MRVRLGCQASASAANGIDAQGAEAANTLWR